MAKENKFGKKDLEVQFPDEATCLEYLFDLSHNRQCSCGGRYSPLFTMMDDKLEGRRKFQCSKCRYQIAPMAGTLFQKSTTSLSLWFHAIFIFSNAKSGISAKEMERQLNVTYKCAYRILSLIRYHLGQRKNKLHGKVEIDEAHFGGKGDGGKYNENYKAVMAKKIKVIGAVERGGQFRAKHVPDIQAKTISEFLTTNVEKKNTKLYTDQSNRYNNVARGYNRMSVNHSQKEYVRGQVHVNNVERFWGHVKRSVRGTFKAVSAKHFQSYLDSFVFHYNNRGNDRLRFETLLTTLLSFSN